MYISWFAKGWSWNEVSVQNIIKLFIGNHIIVTGYIISQKQQGH